MSRLRDALGALGLAERPAAPTAEIGSSSVSYATVKGGAAALIDPEYRYELRGVQGNRTYQRMRWSDPHIWGLREAQNLPMLQARPAIEPFDSDDPDAVAKAELVERLLLTEYPWRSFLRDSFLDFDYGFAAFEIVWRLEDGETRFRLALRPTSSIAVQDIHVRAGVIDHVVQRPASGGERTIPGEKLVWFAYAKEGDQFSGRPILRAMYKPWVIKEELEVELPIAIRKLGGVPDMTYTGTLTADERAKLEAAGQLFGLAPDAYLLHSDKVQAQVLTGTSTVKDILEAIAQRNTELTSVCQAQVFDLGTSNAGSRALGTTLSDLFTNSITADARRREDVLNSPGGIIHQTVAYNFPTDDKLPRLVFGNVQQVDLRTFAAALLAYSQAALPPELDEWARREMNMPEGAVTQVQVPTESEPPAAAAAKPTEPGEDEAGGSGPQSGARASEATTENGRVNQAHRTLTAHDHGLRLAEPRAPRGVECFVALAEIAGRFDDAKTAVRDATEATREKLVAELIRRAEAAQASGTLAKFSAAAPPMVDKLTAETLEVMRDLYAAGRAQVADEMRRQRQGEPVAEEVAGARSEGHSVSAAEPPRKKARKLDAVDAMRDQAEAVARSIAQATQAGAALAATRVGTGVPLDIASFTEAVSRASTDAALRFGAAVTDMMSMGRSDEMRDQDAEIADYVYSAILDGNACENCEPMDGEVTTDADLAATWAPNPNCLGGDRCRCLVIAELKQEATPKGIAAAESAYAKAVLLRLAEATTALACRETAAPVVNVAPPEPAVVTVNVAPPDPPVVNVAPAEPANVTVNVPEQKPRRVIRATEFITDEAGRITGKRETEVEE